MGFSVMTRKKESQIDPESAGETGTLDVVLAFFQPSQCATYTRLHLSLHLRWPRYSEQLR